MTNLKRLAREYDEDEDSLRRGMVARALVNKILEGPVNDETSDIGMGPVSFDVAMARKHGWSKEQIERAWSVFEALAKAEGEIARLNRPELFEDEGDDEVFVGDLEDEKETACANCGGTFPVHEEAPYDEGVRMLLDKAGTHVGYLLLGSGADNEPEIVCETCGMEQGL